MDFLKCKYVSSMLQFYLVTLMATLLLLLLSHVSHVRLCDSIDGSPPGSPGILQARKLEWAAIYLPNSFEKLVM